MKCICKFRQRAKISHEWFDGTKDRIYCYGYIDKRTGDLLSECMACADNVNKAQDDLDAWNKRAGDSND